MSGDATLVLGASERPDRYSNLAVRQLLARGHSVVAVGARAGTIAGVPVVTGIPEDVVVDTVTVYLNHANQETWIPRLLELRPRRIILNPGAENPELEARARASGTLVENACTLVLLAAGTY